MILSDRDIEKAIRSGRIVVDPPPDESLLDSSALNLRVGDDFRIWKKVLKAKGTGHSLEVDDVDLTQLINFTDLLHPNADGTVVIRPGDFVLVRTCESIDLPIKSRIAARVEGRSRLARLGLGIHITAPTIHAGFRGKITLEILNHGLFRLELRPNYTKICQLIFETVTSIPRRSASQTFSEQTTPLGSPKS